MSVTEDRLLDWRDRAAKLGDEILHELDEAPGHLELPVSVRRSLRHGVGDLGSFIALVNDADVAMTLHAENRAKGIS